MPSNTEGSEGTDNGQLCQHVPTFQMNQPNERKRWQIQIGRTLQQATSRAQRALKDKLTCTSACFRHVFAEVLRISAFNSQEQGWRGLWRFHAVPTASGIGRPFKELSNTAFGYATVLSPEGRFAFRIFSDPFGSHVVEVSAINVPLMDAGELGFSTELDTYCYCSV